MGTWWGTLQGTFCTLSLGTLTLGTLLGNNIRNVIGNDLGNIIGNIIGNSIENIIGNVPITLPASHIEVHPKVQITPIIKEFFYISKYKKICIFRQ
jgi:hypothetical protein